MAKRPNKFVINTEDAFLNKIKWCNWIRDFEFYLRTTNIDDENAKIQFFLSVAGESVEEIYNEVKNGPSEARLEDVIWLLTDYFENKYCGKPAVSAVVDRRTSLSKFIEAFKLSKSGHSNCKQRHGDFINQYASRRHHHKLNQFKNSKRMHKTIYPALPPAYPTMNVKISVTKAILCDTLIDMAIHMESSINVISLNTFNKLKLKPKMLPDHLNTYLISCNYDANCY